MTKTKVNGWVNHGDINPREHGGMFVRDCGDSFDLVSVDNQEHDCFKPARYLFQSINVSKADIMADKGLRDYADANRHDDNTNLIWAATSYISYHGGDGSEYETNNFHQGMRAHGIRTYK